jgi:hydroxymethylglutaryl-CoA reductase
LQAIEISGPLRATSVRFATAMGDAMGMNMISKGIEQALEVMSA